jgi:glycine hydroxymethyltransferase
MLLNQNSSETLKKKDSRIYELVKAEHQRTQSSEEYHKSIFGALEEADYEVFRLITKEYQRRQNTLQLVAAENQCSMAVLAALGSITQNKTAEGFPADRLHGGCDVVDEIERLAVTRAVEAFGAKYANVQPHSGTAANQIVLTALLQSGDRILSLAPDHGGHYSHGAKTSITSKFFYIDNYYVDRETFLLDYETIREQALRFKPKLIICGASVYSRTIDFKRFRKIADEVGSFLLADISHISGLVLAGAHPSPVDYAHFTTTSTYKPGGPRGGLILLGKDYDRQIKVGITTATLAEHIQKATFPGLQGTPYLNNIAAKAVFLKETLSDEYKARQFKIIENAKRLADGLLDLGFDVVTGGTDNHMVLINAANLRDGLTGVIVQKCLEQCGIIVDKVSLPYDKNNPAVTGGIRLGTPIVTKNGMGTKEMENISALIDVVLKKIEIISDSEYNIDESFRREIADKVKQLCGRFPIQ